MSPVEIAGGTFVVMSNGEAEGPSQPLVRYLVERGAAHVVFITHPLSAEEHGGHRRLDVVDGVEHARRPIHAPNRPPFTYALDPVIRPVLRRVDGWFGFNCLATAQGLAARAAHRARRVVHWNVDFVPSRFGASTMTRVYDRLDRWCCEHADGRVELSRSALEGRAERYGLDDLADVAVIPMGLWLADAPVCESCRLSARRIVFVGHLVERMGVDVLVDAVDQLARSEHPIRADIVGGGPLLEPLRAEVRQRSLDRLIDVHGFVPSFADLQRIVAAASIGVAPYQEDATTFSRYADPGKLKVYLAAGLPILMTGVPPNTEELVAVGGAELVEPTGARFAERIDALLGDDDEWRRRRALALEHRRQFDWADLFDRNLPMLGFDVAGDQGGRTKPAQNGSPK